MRIWHKDLIDVLPDNLLLQLQNDCLTIIGNLVDFDSTGDDLCDRMLEYPKTHFTTYCTEVAREVMSREITTQETHELIKEATAMHSTETTFYSFIAWEDACYVTHQRLFEFWHSPRYLQQCLLILEEMYDCDLIMYKDWFGILNKVKTATPLCEETFNSLFV